MKIEDRLYSNGRVGMIVVLDSVFLGSDSPFAKYQQPAFFTIVEDQTPEPRYQGIYVLRDSDGNMIRTQAEDDVRGDQSISPYLAEVSKWAAWMKNKVEGDRQIQDRKISTLRDRQELLKEILVAQGVRVVTDEQAKALGIAKDNGPKVRRVDL